MAEFSPNAQARILRATRRVEHMPGDQSPDRPFIVGDSGDEWQLYELTESLAAFGNADAHPVLWHAVVDSTIAGRKGKYITDTETTREVRDCTGLVTGGVGDRIWCKPIGSTQGTVWMGMLSAKTTLARWVVATADTAWDASNSTIVGTVIDYWDGTDPGATVTLENTAVMFSGDEGATIIASHAPELDDPDGLAYYKMVVPSCPAPVS